MSKWIAAGVVIAMGATGAAQAQSSYYWPAPEITKNAEGQRFFLPMGTPLMLRTNTQISPKDNKPGDHVYLEVAENVAFRGQVVIPIGSPVLAEVTRVQRNGHFGVKGKIGIRLVQVETPNGPVRLGGTAYKEGKSGTVASFGTMVLVSSLGFLIHGTSGQIKPGTAVEAYTTEPMRFTWYAESERARTAMLPAQADAPLPPAKPGFSSLER
ncbi:MAG: hypothetical protein ABI673_04445 [Novosphingobium sp.]